MLPASFNSGSSYKNKEAIVITTDSVQNQRLIIVQPSFYFVISCFEII